MRADSPFVKRYLRHVPPSGWSFQPGGVGTALYFLTDAQADALALGWQTMKRRRRPWAWFLAFWAVLLVGFAWWTFQRIWPNPTRPMGREEAMLLPQSLRWFLIQRTHLRTSVLFSGLFGPQVMMLREKLRLSWQIQQVIETAPKLQHAGAKQEHLQARSKAMSMAARLVSWAQFLWLVVLVAWVCKTFLSTQKSNLFTHYLIIVAYAPSLLAARYLLIWPRFYRQEVSRLERWGTWAAIMILAAAQVVVVVDSIRTF